MGLSARERAGGRRLLELLDTADLFSLAGTVTKKKSTAYTRADAIDTIIQYSQSAYELLNRRKVLRDIIAAYLKSEGVPLLSKFTKAEVIQKTLIYWNNLVSDSCKPFIPSSITQQQEDSDPDSSYPFYFHTLKSSTKSPLEDDSKTSNLDALTPLELWSFNNEMHLSSNFTTCKSSNKVSCVPYNLQNMGIMGLTEQQSAGSRKLLELLDTADLFSLAGTVTMKKSIACTRAEAIDTIVQNSKSAYELLNRRKVLRDVIAAYLKKKGIPLPTRVTKAELIQKTLMYWNNLDSCKPPSIMQQQEISVPDASHPFYFPSSKSSTYIPLEYARKTSSLAAVKPLLEEVPAVMCSHNKDSVTSIIKQEMFSDVPRHKVSSDVSSYTFPSDDSKLFTRSWQNKAREEQKSSSLEWDPQYDVNHFGPSFKSPTYLLRVVENTVIKGDKGYPQKSQSSSFVSEIVPRRTSLSTLQTMRHVEDFEAKIEKLKATPFTSVRTNPHMTTRAILQTERQSVNVGAKTEKMAASLHTGVAQHTKKVSQSPFVHQSARDKRESAVKVASLSSAIKDEEDN